MARLYRDQYGVPHVRGTDVMDLAGGQGYAAARDRAWQLEFQRRRATGTAAQILGMAQLPWDVFARRIGIATTAERALAALSDESRAFVAAFVEGVNTGLHAQAPEFERLGLAPQPWEPWTPLAVFHAQHVLFAGLSTKLWHHRARAVLGADEALLSRDPAYLSGSNAWAVGGARTSSGLPLMAGDPHRGFESPNVYTQVRLVAEDEDIDVLGLVFPGVPGVQHFAHAGRVAWAITNAASDYQDIFEESLDDVVDGHEEYVAVRGAEPVTVEVLSTVRGPLFELDRSRGTGLVLRDAATVLGDLGFEALLPLLRASSVADVDRAWDHWVAPVDNVVIADVDGAVRFRYAGRVPVRPQAHRRGIVTSQDPDGDWSGWLDLGGHDIAPAGSVVTANERRGPESDAIGTEFAGPHRADRIAELLGDRGGLGVADATAIHADTLAGSAATAQAFLDSLGPLRTGGEQGGERVRREILGWDGQMDKESRGAAAYAAWRHALARRISAEPVFAALAEVSVYGPLWEPALDVAATVGLGLERLISQDRPFGIDVRRLAVAALEDAVDHPGTWGATHVFEPVHAFHAADPDLIPDELAATSLSGDIDTVLCSGWLPGRDQAAYRGAVARYAWDLSAPSASGWVVPMGACGDPSSPHHLDQHDAWAGVRLLRIETDWARLTPVEGP